MVWWLVKEYFSAMIRPLRLTTYSGRCVAVKFCTIVSYLLIFINYTTVTSVVSWLVKEHFSVMISPFNIAYYLF